MSQEFDIISETKMLSNRNSRVAIDGIFHNIPVITSTSALSDESDVSDWSFSLINANVRSSW